jgi:predicted  nucleic acid-binding Zn-ribbon protein
MHPDLEKLIRLQQVDSEIARLRAEVAALPKRVAAIEAKLADAKARVESAKNAIKNDELARRKFEGEIQTQQQKISKYRDQSLSVKTNEEYRALMKEVEYAEQAIRKFEDQILETMVDADSKLADQKKAEGELNAETAEIEKEKEHARAVTAEDEKKLAEDNAERDTLRSGVDADVIRIYDRVSKLRGSAIAEAKNQMCSACRVMLRPQVYQDILNGTKVVTCDSCQRILYYIAPVEEPAPAASAEQTA